MYQVIQLVDVLVTVYIICVFIWALMSWLPLPNNAVVGALRKFLDDVVTPYINVFRGLIPPVGAGGAQIDLSPMVAIFVLIILKQILVQVAL